MKITPQQALARLSPQGMHKAKGTPSITYQGDLEDGAIYLFKSGEEAILSPSDDELPAVIGRFEGSQGNGIPPSMAAWLQETAAEIYHKANAPTTTNAPRKVAKATTTTSKRVTVQPLVKATWGQGAPYNQNLIFDGKASYVGCNAVAISQILLYFYKKGYKRGCKPIGGYTTKTNKYKVDKLPSITCFDYANMTFCKPTTASQKKAVAEMCEYVAKAIRSDFTPDGTLAYLSKDITALKTYLRMGNPKKINASSGYDAWEEKIYIEIADGRPVIMAGWTQNGGGHTFVVDGYDAEADMYHFNWGWGGSCDGWFKLTALDVTTARAYNSNKQAIVCICPEYVLGDVDGDGEVTVTDVMDAMDAAMEGRYSECADVNSDGKVTVTDVEAIAGMRNDK